MNTEIPAPIVTGAVVCPLRFTAHPDRTTRLFELLGLRTVIRERGFVVLQGRGGRLAVHPLETAASTSEPTTSVMLEVPDAADAARRLTEAGLRATWWDEAWGRQATVAGPVGTVWLNGELEDRYGHEVIAPDPAPTADVVAALFTDADRATDFFRAFGFVPGADATGDWRPLRAGRRSGILGVIPSPSRGEREPAVEVGIETTESLDTVATRLERDGWPVEFVLDNGPRHLIVTDPDGGPVEVYESSDPA